MIFATTSVYKTGKWDQILILSQRFIFILRKIVHSISQTTVRATRIHVQGDH